MYTITFEVGDIAHCPYYNYTGVIIELKSTNNQNWVILQDTNKPKEHKCATKIKTTSLNDLHPVYLQLICKKEDYEAIGKTKIFGHPSNPKQNDN